MSALGQKRTFCRSGNDVRFMPKSGRLHHKIEIEKWWPIVKAAGIKVD
jgi:hypothetical protein